MGCKILISCNYLFKKCACFYMYESPGSDNTLHIFYKYFSTFTCILATMIHKMSHPWISSGEGDQRHCEANTPSSSLLRVDLPPGEQMKFLLSSRFIMVPPASSLLHCKVVYVHKTVRKKGCSLKLSFRWLMAQLFQSFRSLHIFSDYFNTFAVKTNIVRSDKLFFVFCRLYVTSFLNFSIILICRIHGL